jgi:hypothetical protein
MMLTKPTVNMMMPAKKTHPTHPVTSLPPEPEFLGSATGSCV